jgi:hypothetical protein
MTANFLPLRLLLLTLAGWVNRHQQHVIDYLVEGEPRSTSVVHSLDARSRFQREAIHGFLPGSVAGEKPKEWPFFNELAMPLNSFGAPSVKTSLPEPY